MKWIQVSIPTEDNETDTLSDFLMALGALSVTHIDAEDQAVFQHHPRDTPHWKKSITQALFNETSDITSIMATLKQWHPSLNDQWNTECIEDQDWVRLTQSQFPPININDQLWVYPAWHQENKQLPHIIIDPGLAFGTGTHPTTAMCLEAISEHLQPNDQVVDFGCGSGILSIATAALGASVVLATDHDEQAEIATAQNMTLNPSIANRIHVVHSDTISEAYAACLLANILGPTLVELRDNLIRLTKPKGILILSGLLTDEIEKIKNHFCSQCDVIDCKTQEEWACIILQKKN